MWGVGRMQVHGICGRSLEYRVVVEARSNYEKSYLWWFRNLACGYSIGCNRIEKDRICVPPGLVGGGRRGEGAVSFSVCGAPLDDWANGSSVDVFFTYGMVLVL